MRIRTAILDESFMMRNGERSFMPGCWQMYSPCTWHRVKIISPTQLVNVMLKPIDHVSDEGYCRRSEKLQMWAAAGQLFCDGNKPEQILAAIQREFPELSRKANRETPMRWVQKAIDNGWIKFHPPWESKMEAALAESFEWKRQGIRVVESRSFAHVSMAGATHLMELVQGLKNYARREKVRIGIAGGRQVHQLCRSFAGMLEETPGEELPEQIVIHAMVAAFGDRDYRADPNSFMGYFDPNKIAPEIRFVRIAGPGIVETNLRKGLRKYREIDQAYKAAEKLDIIVSGGGDWQDDHSTSAHYLRAAHADDVTALKQERAVGDLLWQPISENGPIDLDVKGKFKFRPNTLVDLKELPYRISNGARVLLALGPCGECGKPKGNLLRAIMNLPEQLVTDIVTDSPTARDALLGHRNGNQAT